MTRRRYVTIPYVLSLGPCDGWDKKRLLKVSGGRKRLSPWAVLRLEAAPEDKLWLLLREDFLSPRSLRLFAADCAEHVLHFFEKERPSDGRPRRAVEAARATSYARLPPANGN